MAYLLARSDAVRLPLPDRSVDLVFGSPPYCDARTYGIGAQRDCLAWVEWMLAVTAEAYRVSRGPVLWVAAGVTRDRNYWAACEGLMWRWWLQGGGDPVYVDGLPLRGDGQLYRPCYWHRVGVPGSGHNDWFRADVEYVMCFKRPGPLPWSDNTAMGHPPKWAPGGEMSHRLGDGTRRNQWGGGEKSSANRTANGGRQKPGRPSHQMRTNREANGKMREQGYSPPAKANPGNLVSIKVGGGLLGHELAHENEAPFPEDLARWFILSLCPPGGLVLDPFSGSGTTASVAARNSRHGIGFDLRQSQCELGQRRITEQVIDAERPHRQKANENPVVPLPGQRTLFDAEAG